MPEWYDDKPMFSSPEERDWAMYNQIKNSLTGDEQFEIELDLITRYNH